jgi:uridylate kinase
MMDTVVLSLGGSVLVRDDDSSEYIGALAKALRQTSGKIKLYVVTGGGRIARFYIRTGRQLGAEESYLDKMGIEATRLNARLLVAAIGDMACPEPPRDYDEAAMAGEKHSIIVMGGVAPGITTDAVSAFLAERVGASRLVNATSVDGAYTADPKKDPGATRIPRMSHEELVDLVIGTPAGAGPNVVFDPTGAKVLARTGISLAIVDGTDIGNLVAALEGNEFHGTSVG